MQKIIFIGGTSGVGKTTLAKALAKKQNSLYVHFFKSFHSFFGRPDKCQYYSSLGIFIHILAKQLLAEKKDAFIDIHYALQLDSKNCWNKRDVDLNALFHPTLQKRHIEILNTYFDVYAVLILTGYRNVSNLGITKEQFEKESGAEFEYYLKLPLENERKLVLLRNEISFMAQLLQLHILGKKQESQMT